MLFLITRPVSEGRKTAGRLERMGVEAVLQPCFSVNFLEKKALVLTGKNIVIITSLNGAKAYFRNYPESLVGILTVGEKAAEFLKKKGKKIQYSAKNVDGLVGFIKENIGSPLPLREGLGGGVLEAGQSSILKSPPPQPSPSRGEGEIELLYIRGNKVKKDLVRELEGFRVKERVLYETIEEKAFSPETTRLLKAKKISGVLFYSGRTVKLFNKMLNASGLANFLDQTEVFCLSPSIAKACSRINYKKIHVAAEPDENSLFELIKNYVDKHG